MHDLPFLLEGLRVTVEVCLGSFVGASTLGTLIGLGLLSQMRVISTICLVYVNVFRNTPFLVQLVWFYYVLPILTGFSLGIAEAGVLALSLYTASYVAEVLRSGILSVGKGQHDAASALGMTSTQRLRRIILPQALIYMLPVLVSLLVTMIKDSALTSVIGLPELLYSSEVVAASTLHDLSAFTVAGVLYFVVTYPLTLLGNRLQRRMQFEHH